MLILTNTTQMRRNNLYIALILIFFLFFTNKGISQNESQENLTLYSLGEKFVTALKSNQPEKILEYIDANINTDDKTNIFKTFLQLKENIANITNISTLNLINVIKNNDFTYIILKNGDKFFIVKTKTSNKNHINGQIKLLNTKVNELLTKGEKVYKKYCYSCHNKYGKGSIGSNLIDNYWIHISSEKDLIDIITNGKKGTMMIAYKDYLNPEEIKAVAVYIKILQGKKVKNEKKPEGENKNINFNIFN